MSFHEIRFPVSISFGAHGGPERRTDIVMLALSGFEQRNARWSASRRTYNAGYGVKSLDDLHSSSPSSRNAAAADGFRFKDPTDWRSSAPERTPTALDQSIRHSGTGSLATFQLKKRYGSLHAPYDRDIKKPVTGTVLIAVADVTKTAGTHFDIDTTTGLVTFRTGNIPATGTAITAGFDFDVPVRFDTDKLEINVQGFPSRRNSFDPAGRNPHLTLSFSLSSAHSMKTLPSTMQARLDSGATTLCWCWRLTRRSGVRLGFTDHDRNLTFDGTTFEASAGFTASEIRDSLGLSVDNLEVESALRRRPGRSLAAGDFDDTTRGNLPCRLDGYDAARLDAAGIARRVYVVPAPPSPPRSVASLTTCSSRKAESSNTLATPHSATHAAVSTSHRHDIAARERSRSPRRSVRSPHRGSQRSPTAGSSKDFSRRPLAPMRWLLQRDQAPHPHCNGRNLRTVAADAVAHHTGDTFTVTAGCDKLIATCRDKFANTVNYRGFPHMPGNDTIASYTQGGSTGSSA